MCAALCNCASSPVALSPIHGISWLGCKCHRSMSQQSLALYCVDVCVLITLEIRHGLYLLCTDVQVRVLSPKAPAIPGILSQVCLDQLSRAWFMRRPEPRMVLFIVPGSPRLSQLWCSFMWMDYYQAVLPTQNAPWTHLNGLATTEAVNIGSLSVFPMLTKPQALNDQCNFAALKMGLIAASRYVVRISGE